MHHCQLCHIELKHLSVVRGGQTLLEDVNMHIHCGELTALIGQNGAGKTTLIRALLGDIPSKGQIMHVDAKGLNIPRVRTGYVPQQLLFDRDMPVTVADFMASAFSRRPVWTGISRATRMKIEEALEKTEARELINTPLGRCSGGELQRVLLALAITPAPDLLLLDEPVSGIDQNGLEMFLKTVCHLRDTHHMAILLVSHDLPLVRQYADHVVLLDKTVRSEGSAMDVFASEAFIKRFHAGEGK